VRQLLAALDVADRLDEDAAVLVHRLAVRFARVVDPARVVAAPAAVDHRLVVDGEEEGVVRLDVVVVAAVGLFPTDPFAPVLDQARALGDAARGEHALAVDLRAADLEGTGHWRLLSRGRGPRRRALSSVVESSAGVYAQMRVRARPCAAGGSGSGARGGAIRACATCARPASRLALHARG